MRQSSRTLRNFRPTSGRDQHTVRVSFEGEANPARLIQLLDRVQRSTHVLRVTELTSHASESQTQRVSRVVSKRLLK